LPLFLQLPLLFFLSFPLGESASALALAVVLAVALAFLSVIPPGNLLFIFASAQENAVILSEA